MQATNSMSMQPKNGWLFILGVNNSGTTLFARILESHPDILALPHEGQLLTEALPRPDYENVVRLWTKKMEKFRLTQANDGTPAKAAHADWMKLYPARPGLRLEKSPPNTIRSLWLQKYFPDTMFIALTRHPYAVCEGIRRRMGCTLEEAASHWNIANTILLEDIPKLEKCILMKYEELMSNPDMALVNIARFLGIKDAFDRQTISELESHSIDGQTRGLTNMNQKSFDRLTNHERLLIDHICSKTMDALGYTHS